MDCRFKKPKKIEEFELLLDQNLKNVNSDYEAKRYKDIIICSKNNNS